jgi:RNA polymerase primary sigma factor
LRRAVRRGREAEEHLLGSTCGLVRQRIYALGFRVDRDELESAGLEGLVSALRSFDASRGARFSTYASYWINKMVFAAISRRAPYPEADLRLVVKLRRLVARTNHVVTVGEVAQHLHLARAEASRIMKVSDDIAAGTATLDDTTLVDDSSPWPEAEWIIDQLKSILVADFEDFWMWTGRVMSLEELGRRHGISKQAMAKRAKRWRRLVESSEHAEEMLTWLRAQ